MLMLPLSSSFGSEHLSVEANALDTERSEILERLSVRLHINEPVSIWYNNFRQYLPSPCGTLLSWESRSNRLTQNHGSSLLEKLVYMHGAIATRSFMSVRSSCTLRSNRQAVE